jgi:hypothetical protein
LNGNALIKVRSIYILLHITNLSGISMAAETDLLQADQGGVPSPRIRAGRQHVLETACGLLASAPAITYLLSFIVRMRYCPDSDSCQVVIQPHYTPAEGNDDEIMQEIVTPLSQEIRKTLGKQIPRRTCAYLSAHSTLDQDNLADLFILYFFTSGDEKGSHEGAPVWGVYQMNQAFRTFAPEMEEIAITALERCLSVMERD